MKANLAVMRFYKTLHELYCYEMKYRSMFGKIGTTKESIGHIGNLVNDSRAMGYHPLDWWIDVIMTISRLNKKLMYYRLKMGLEYDDNSTWVKVYLQWF